MSNIEIVDVSKKDNFSFIDAWFQRSFTKLPSIITACPGGVYRSRRTAKYIEDRQLGICHHNVSIQASGERFMHGINSSSLRFSFIDDSLYYVYYGHAERKTIDGVVICDAVDDHYKYLIRRDIVSWDLDGRIPFLILMGDETHYLRLLHEDGDEYID